MFYYSESTEDREKNLAAGVDTLTTMIVLLQLRD
jgi:hypothetical protein